MRITYVARSFLDYRVPVLAELDKLCGNELRFISSTKLTPERALKRLRGVLGERAVYLSGEKSLGVDNPIEANTSICIPFQPGLMRAIAQSQPDRRDQAPQNRASSRLYRAGVRDRLCHWETRARCLRQR